MSQASAISVDRDFQRVPAELSIVVPTFNERENVPLVVEALDAALGRVNWEVVFVDDDSTDGTLGALAQAARGDTRVRYLHRIGRRGLSSAVTEGIQSTSAPIVAVMDADMQHDERLLPQMHEAFADPSLDVAVGSRYVDGGGLGEWAEDRKTISRVATELSRLVIRNHLTDPMSGFFMIRREAFESAHRNLSNQGYKILLDILASAKRALKAAEFAYTFRNRSHGESKLDEAAVMDYIALLIDKSIGAYIPSRFVIFSMVGALGVVVHMSILAGLFETGFASFLVAQAVATAIAMTFNFFINNTLTYRDKRLKGFGQIARGLLTFGLVSAVGAIANVGVANFLFVQNYAWYVSGIAGILVGAVWNYAASATFTWGKK